MRYAFFTVLLTSCGHYHVGYERSLDNTYGGLVAGTTNKGFTHNVGFLGTSGVKTIGLTTYTYLLFTDSNYTFYVVERAGWWFLLSGGLGVSVRFDLALKRHQIITIDIKYPDDLETTVRPYISQLFMGGFYYVFVAVHIQTTWDSIVPLGMAGLRF